MKEHAFYVGREGREVFWNIPLPSFEIILFALTAVALAVMAFGIYRRWLMWKAMGKPEMRLDDMQERVKMVLKEIFLQNKVLKDPYPGIMHALIFFGFFVLIFGAAFDAGQHHVTEPLFGWTFLKGNFYLVFSFLMDLFGLFVLIGVVIALDRRFVQKPDRLGYKGEMDNTPDDVIVLLLIGAIILTGFIAEALRIYVTNPSWEYWSFVGWLLAHTFTGVEPDTARTLHQVTWWVHAVLGLSFIAYIPYSRLLHIITTPANHFLSSRKPTGYIEPIRDFENAEAFGVGKLEEFTWKQIFDSDACTRCGRCQDGCPAYLTGKPLSPKKLTQDLKTFWLEQCPDPLMEKVYQKLGLAPAPPSGGEAAAEAPAEEATGKALVGEVIDLHELWACTNCMYCMEHCSASIEHVPKIIDMRRYKVLTEADFSPELQLSCRNMENNSNPWGVGAHLRGDWAKELGVKTLAEDPNVEYLFYVGCSGSFDDRGKKISIAFAKILQEAGVSFGILGTEEGCCGDSAMRCGNEYLFQTLAQANIDVMNGYGVKKIIAICPHGYNALKKDYPNFGGNFEVYHHTEILAKLIEERKIKLTQPLKGSFVYHDSCFLGRYNKIYDQPRKILKSIPGIDVVEMERSLDKSFCCGAGGARMWMEEDIGERINNARTKQAIQAGADTIAVGCPFCLTMMSDGIKDNHKEETMQAWDLAELVLKAMGKEEVKPPVDACAV
ncbi:MAG TPA: heterodisulfide reductase-related iron-sulfur binding cluster [Smithellaceae bacterium]|nr:heterodisulfide reductase-related iron-sulfur binding cluster [Smithellaceae bacterium]HRS83929.1 heterodisulfide reductase-related iron-sulfur binding cluster [Smithellaceae bacterium]HRV45360.1 heterodisulfide reductase-related iron-sulfur binding cluster [Smithellaceae bacterium]